MQAARAGIEWGIYQSIVKSNCAATNPSFSGAGAAISAFSIVVECSASTHQEGPTSTPSIVTYQLTSTATTGTYGTLDYVSRRLQATVSEQPP